MTPSHTTKHLAERLLRETRSERDRFVSLLTDLTSVESPTEDVDGQLGVQEILRTELAELDYDSSSVPARNFADHLVARPSYMSPAAPTQLIVGHCDTVWPLGTLNDMPVRVEDGCLRGPGAFDMKCGLAQAVMALRALRSIGAAPEIAPVLFVNSDEEVGSPDSRDRIVEHARGASRAIVLEPSFGPTGLVKTSRKGVSRYRFSARGRAAHSGLEPAKGASAVLAIAHAITELHALNDLSDGTTVNVGVVRGGTRPNVIPERAHAQIDVRVTSVARAEQIDHAIRSLVPKVPRVSFEVEACESAPPLEPTERNLELWQVVRELGDQLGIELDHTSAGGASDGNTTSQFTPTIDGMGAVGDGAHAVHEHIVIDPSLDRAALLALLLLAPATEAPAANGANGAGV